MEDVTNYFHYPASKSKEYTELRQATTNWYGQVTTAVLAAYLVSIPVLNYLVKRGVNFHSKFQALRWVNGRLNALAGGGASAWRHSAVRAAKLACFRIYYHLSSILQVTFWLVVLTVLSLSDLYGGDLIFLAKRLGRIASNCLPTIFFLSLRPSPLPNTLYLSLIPTHKWLSRIVILQAAVHTALYCGFFQKNHTWVKAWKTENLYGWAAMVGFAVIIITSVSSFRNRYYRFFFFQHYVWSWIIVVCLQFHVRPVKLTAYTAVNVSLLLGQIAYRWSLTTASRPGDVRVTNVAPNLSLVEFPSSLVAKAALNPGAHIRITNYHPLGIARACKQLIPNYHPYTLVSLPTDAMQKLIVRKGSFKFSSNQQYTMYGSFDPHLLFIKNNENSFRISRLKFHDTKRVLIVVGGSAISFALPILRTMNYHGIPVKIVWVVKDFRDISVLRFFDGYIHGDDFEIFVTGNNHSGPANSTTGYGSMATSTSVDLERNQEPLFEDLEEPRQRVEDENVDISVDQQDSDPEEDEDCYRTDHSESTDTANDTSDTESEASAGPNDTDSLLHELSPVTSRKTYASTNTNEQFIPKLQSMTELGRAYVGQYNDTVRRLNIGNKIYRGRPKLDHRYFNWCLHEGFTQCSGPVEIGSSLVCCRDLPRNNVTEADASKVWVISAGPLGLVNNVKLWAKENGLKFHEEAFYV